MLFDCRQMTHDPTQGQRRREMLEGDLLFGTNGLRWEARFQLREEFGGSAVSAGNVHFSQREDGGDFQHLETVALAPCTIGGTGTKGFRHGLIEGRSGNGFARCDQGAIPLAAASNEPMTGCRRTEWVKVKVLSIWKLIENLPSPLLRPLAFRARGKSVSSRRS
jgi:hypothetical protein